MAFDASSKKLGTEHHSYNRFPCISAGHQKHVYTTGCAWPLIKKKFDKAMEIFSQQIV